MKVGAIQKNAILVSNPIMMISPAQIFRLMLSMSRSIEVRRDSMLAIRIPQLSHLSPLAFYVFPVERRAGVTDY